MKKFLFLIIILISISCRKEEIEIIPDQLSSNLVYDEFIYVRVLPQEVYITNKYKEDCIIQLLMEDKNNNQYIIDDIFKIGETKIFRIDKAKLNFLYLQYITYNVYYNFEEPIRIVNKN